MDHFFLNFYNRYISPHLYISAGLLLIIIAIIILEIVLFLTRPRQISSEEAIRLFNSEGGQFLDVREKNPFAKRSIVGSINCPYKLLLKSTDFLKKYHDKDLIVVCDLGNKAKEAARFLKKGGFSVAVLRGGLENWRALGLPVKEKR